MKIWDRMTLAALCACTIALGAPELHAKDLGHMAGNGRPIKVYLRDFANDSGQMQISMDSFRREVEKAFAGRRSVAFEVVDSPGQSDVEVSGRVKQYLYQHRGPLKPSIGVAFMLADAAATATSNYVEMAVEFAVIDSRTGGIVWNDTVGAYLKRVMTPEESIPLIFDKVARNFVSKSFGKGR